MKTFSEAVRLPVGDDSIGPVQILDGQGNLVRIVSAAEFRQAHRQTGASGPPVGGSKAGALRGREA
jgi:hypothetical protein